MADQKPEEGPAHGVDLTLVGTEDMLRELTSRFDASVIALHNFPRRPENGRPGAPEDTVISWHGGGVAARGLAAMMARRVASKAGW